MRALLLVLAMTGWLPSLPVASAAPASSAPYYVILDGGAGLGVAVTDGFTGRTVATVRSPDRTRVDGVAAAGDDRTFVMYSSKRFYELRLGSNGRPSWVRALAGTPPLGGTAFAVSPDAQFAGWPTGTGITVVSLVTGVARSWADGPSGNVSDPSWAGDRYLAFQWQPLGRRGAAYAGVRLLDTYAGGSVLSSSRMVVAAGQLPKGMRGILDPLISADGSSVVTAVWTGPAGRLTAEIAKFSARTGRLIAVLLPPASMPGHGFPCTAVWMDPSAAHLMASCGVSGVVDGTRFTEVNLNLPNTSGITFNPFLAW